MELKDYPGAIAKLAIEIHGLDLEISISQGSLKLVEYDIDQQIAFDATLTNDAKRKAMRVALLEMNVEYPRHEVKLEGFKNQRQFALIELDKLRGEFSVAKIEARERIARLEVSI
jgi:dihydroneopterin aldolase